MNHVICIRDFSTLPPPPATPPILQRSLPHGQDQLVREGLLLYQEERTRKLKQLLLPLLLPLLDQLTIETDTKMKMITMEEEAMKQCGDIHDKVQPLSSSWNEEMCKSYNSQRIIKWIEGTRKPMQINLLRLNIVCKFVLILDRLE